MPNVVKTVQIVVDAKDQASKTLGSIGHTLSTAIGSFVGGAALKIATTGFDTLTGAIGDCIQESRDAAKGLAQTDAVIKSTGGKAKVTARQIVDLAGSLSKTTLFSDDSVQSLENLILTFTNVRNEAGAGNDIFTQTTKIGLDMAQALGTDAAGAAIQLGKALNDPEKGMKALTRVGVTFTAEQKDMITTLQDAGDIMGAQKIILAELTAEFGGSAEAAAKADGGWHLFNQRLSDVKQTIGDALMPVLNDLMTWLSGPGLDAVEKWGGAFATWITSTAVPALSKARDIVVDLVAAFKTGNFEVLEKMDLASIFGPGGAQVIVDGLESIRVGFGKVKDTWNDLIAAFKTGNFEVLQKMDLASIFGPAGAQAITDSLQAIREGWRLARDAVITFQEALAGDWKNADTIRPLHQAVGELGLAFRAAFGWLTETGLPALAQALIWLDETGFPALQKVLAPVVAFIKDDLAAVLSSLAAMLIAVVVPAFIAWGTAAAAAALETALALAAVALPILAIGAAVGLLVTAWTHDWGGMRTFLTAWWERDVEPILSSIWTWLSVNIPKALKTLGGWWDLIWLGLTRQIKGSIDLLNDLIALLNKVPGVHIGSIPGGTTPGGQAVIGAQLAGISARGIPLTLPSGFAAPPSTSIAPKGGSNRPSLTVDLRGSTFGAGLTEGQVKGWIAPVLDDALTRWEHGLMRETTDLATRGALR